VANGTAALHVALYALGIGSGDEVLVPSFTFAATAGAVIAVGATPVFTDIGDDFLIDLDDAAARVTPRTAAIMPVHLFGLMVDMQRVAAFAERHGLAIIEDVAQAHLASRAGIPAGTTGVGAFSLYATKNMMTGEGGVVTTNSLELAERSRLFRNHGMPERYVHAEWGLNLRMTDLLAAIGRAQLERLPDATRARRSNAKVLNAQLPELYRTPPDADDAYHVYHQYTVTVPANVRDRLVEGFRARGIGVDVYYPTPLHQQPAYIDLAGDGARPRSEWAAASVISLPIHPKVGAAGLERIVTAATELEAML
jgi:dTDP-4-amino-4,6-dideoxygalactose transaminase